MNGPQCAGSDLTSPHHRARDTPGFTCISKKVKTPLKETVPHIKQ